MRCRNTATDRSTPASRIGTNRISRREEFAGQHVLVVGGGASAVQLLAEISEVARTTWVTRQPPEWRTDEEFGPELGRSVVAKVEERVRAGLPPRSVVSVTGLHLREQEQAALWRGVYQRQPMVGQIIPDGVHGPTRRTHRASRRHPVGDWLPGRPRPSGSAAPAGALGGIRMDGNRTVLDRCVHLVGYGPSASTIGGNRAGFAAVRELRDLLRSVAA